jgi:hypothetical protein
MSDLRDAAELALTALENTCPNTWTSVKENLRKALAQPEPVHAIDISQERVDETAKRKHEFFCPRCGHCCQQREWVGLTEDEAIELLPVGDWEIQSTLDFARAIEAKLKEKNS